MEVEFNKKIKTFEDLECWKACVEVRRYTSILLKNYPKEELYNLVDQMKRSSRSAPDNIAEGFGRFHYQENVQYCRNARGSLSELTNQYITSLDEKYITQNEYNEGRRLIERAWNILNGYIKYLLKAKDNMNNEQ